MEPTRQVQRMSRATQALAYGQGAFWLGTGVWPLVDLDSFAAVTGRKPEGWLVKTVGLLITAVGAGVLLAARARRYTPELALIAGGSAAALTGVDVFYGLKRRISPVYLLDVVPELLIAVGWLAAHRAQSAHERYGSRQEKFESLAQPVPV